MLKYLLVVVCLAWLGSLLGCNRKPKVVKVDQLSFPVIRVFEDAKNSVFIEAIENKEDLSFMSTGYGLLDAHAPLVIDSNANICEMTDIKTRYFGLWVLIRPTGQQPFHFTLIQRKESGIKAAQGLIANCRFFGNLDEKRSELRREQIRKATKVEEIIQILCEAPPSSPKKVKIDKPNEKGFAKISIRDGDIYQEGIVDANGNEVVQASSKMLVDDITGSLALVRVERKFLFVPLDDGYVSLADLDGVNGFQYAEPYSCGLARVSVEDVEFYLDSNFEKAFGLEFEFAESFHHDRAYVKVGDRHRIIDTRGNTVADLEYDQVNLQSPWCWQVTKIEQEKYLNGFVDLNGKLITELIYDSVGRFDPEVNRIRVSRDGLHGYLNEVAKVAIPVQYEFAEPFDKGKAKVALDGRAFFINPDGIEVPE